jgi:UDP-N-acetylglucosamine/UDP-N-acetylgalactosamine 4-epimerase
MKSKVKILITGGAGFIGSNLVEHFLNDKRVELVRVIDNLSNGYLKNIQKFLNNKKFEFIEGDIRDYTTCMKACKGIHKISHQAALGSVPRSVENPMESSSVNILGTVNILHAAKENNVERVILAFSSSTYGDLMELPKIENNIGNPLSPYAVTKLCNEQFAQVFGNTYNLKWIGLRYFNVFGPNQNPDNPYAAVIPIFIKAFLKKSKINVFGDGNISRDFTYVSNVILMNELCLFTENHNALFQIFNTACGNSTTLNEIILKLEKITGYKVNISYKNKRSGDIEHSLASIEKAKKLLGYIPNQNFEDGLKKVYKWYKNNYE